MEEGHGPLNSTDENGRDRTIVRLAVPLAIGVFVIGAAGTLFKPAYVVSGPALVPMTAKQAAVKETARAADESGAILAMGRSVDASRAIPSAADTERTFERGQGLVASGDFAAARLLFTRAAEAGHAGAWFALASTYDPNVLSARGARGLVGEPDQARALYAKALEAGVPGAKERLAALGG